MLTAGIKHSTLIREAFERFRNVRAKTKLAFYPIDDRRQCQAGRILIGFAKPDTLYSPNPHRNAPLASGAAR
jgi:hypothetical protein